MVVFASSGLGTVDFLTPRAINNNGHPEKNIYELKKSHLLTL